MRNRFAVSPPPPPASPPATLLEEVDLAGLRQQHFVAFAILLGCAIVFIALMTVLERDKKEEQ